MNIPFEEFCETTGIKAIIEKAQVEQEKEREKQEKESQKAEIEIHKAKRLAQIGQIEVRLHELSNEITIAINEVFGEEPDKLIDDKISIKVEYKLVPGGIEENINCRFGNVSKQKAQWHITIDSIETNTTIDKSRE